MEDKILHWKVFFLMKELTREEIKEVLRLYYLGDFDTIYEQFGSDIYLKMTPRKMQALDKKYLFEIKDFYTLLKKHRIDAYLNPIFRDVYLKTGSELKANFAWYLKKTWYYWKISFFSFLLSFLLSRTAKKSISEIEYAEEIRYYNTCLEEYKKSIEEYSFNDFQIIINYLNDCQNDYFYKAPEIDADCYQRLDMEINGYGVCRNYADDCKYKLNSINEDFYVRNCSVIFFQEEKDVGAHAISLLDLPNTPIILAVDATNNYIGVLKNGELYFFNMSKSNKMEIDYTRTFLSHFSLTNEDFVWTIHSVIKSYFNPYTIEELEEMFGENSQNKTREYIRNLKR